MRADFRATAWFQPAVKTGADGRAHVRFKLPDNLTTFRVMAVAVGKDDRFGDGETQVTTSRPLMLRPALPRFLRAGDAIEAGVIVTPKGMPDAAGRGDGGGRGPDAWAARRSARSPCRAGESVEVRWPITAPRAGTAKLTFRARAGGEADAVEVDPRVDAPATMETVALDGRDARARAPRSWATSAPSATTWAASTCAWRRRRWWASATGWSSSSSTRTAAPSSSRAASCRSWPRGTWPTTSASRCPKDPDALVDVAIAKILANQRSDGGFGWWPDSRESDPWVTAYALWGLDAAKKEGARCRTRRSTARRSGCAAGCRTMESAPRWTWRGRAFVVDVLATIGQARPGLHATASTSAARRCRSSRARCWRTRIAVGKMDRAQAQELAARPRAAPAHHARVGDRRRQPRRRLRAAARLAAAHDGHRAPRAGGARSAARARAAPGAGAARRARERAVALDPGGGVVAPGARRLPARARRRRRTSTRACGSPGQLALDGAVPRAQATAAARARRVPMATAARRSRTPTLAFQVRRLGDALLRGAPALRAQGAAARRARPRVLRAQAGARGDAGRRSATRWRRCRRETQDARARGRPGAGGPRRW